MKLKNRTILITGGSSGIGLELAKRLLAAGNTVLITGRDAGRLAKAKQNLPGLHTFESDVSDPGAIADLYSTVIQRFPNLDVLINNAGVMKNMNLNNQQDLRDITGEIEINLNGPIRMIQQFLSHLKTRPEALIVNVSSALAFVPYPVSPVYCATKAGLHSYTQSLRIQLRGTSVKVAELCPPAVGTPLLDVFESEMKGQKPMAVETLGEAAITGIEAGKFEITPGLSGVLKTLGRLAPEFALNQLANASKPK